MSNRRWELLCVECGRFAFALGAKPFDEWPTFRPLCKEHYSDFTGGYWLSVEDLRANGLAWWLIHITWKSWGKRSDFDRIVAGILNYAKDERVWHEPAGINA